MNFSTPQQPKPPSPLSILLIGPPGGGKTTLALQFPKVCVLDCGSKLDGPERTLRKRLPTLAYAYIPINFDEDGQVVDVDKAFDRLMDKTLELKKEPKEKVQVVVLDDLTQTNEYIVRNVLSLQNKKRNPYEMEARDWTPFKSKAYQLLVGRLQGLGRTTICLCHERKIEETTQENMMIPKVVGYEPAFQGGITDYFGHFFTDMWRCEIRLGPQDKQEFWVRTRKTTKSELKCSFPDMPAEIDVTKGAEPLLKYLEGKI